MSEPTFNKIKKVTYFKKHHNLFDKRISDFVNSELVEREIEQNYTDKFIKIRNNNRFRDANISALQNSRKKS